MLNRVFYHSTIRKYIIFFGNIFNDIVVRRLDASKNEITQFTVPISYSPKMKWIYLLARHPSDQQVAVQIPRLGFEITSISYDSTRKVNPTHTLVNVTDDKDKMLTQFVPMPYKLGIELYCITKYADDAAQITEQIIPFFVPDFNATLNLIPEMEKPFDIRLTLTGMNFQDTYEDTFQTRRGLIWTYQFEMDVWFFGPVQKQGVIKRVQADLYAVPGQGKLTAEEMAQAGRNVRIVVKPGLTADGKPTSNAALSIPHTQIDADDDYGFIQETYFFEDGRRYSPKLNEDI